MTRLRLLATAIPAEEVSRSGGPSAKSFHRTGPSSTHQHDTSEGNPMVDATQPATEHMWTADDYALLAMAEHHEDAADALRQVLASRALLRLVLPGGGSR